VILSPLNAPIRDWRGQRVWIVGASSGIGEALARALHARGARLALSARTAPALHALVRETSGDHLVLPVDITQSDTLNAAWLDLLQAWDGVDLVLWVAGTYAPMRAQTFDPVAARRLVDVNLQAVFHGLGLVLPRLLAQKSGGLALVSSVAGYRGLPKALVYGPTKAALNNLAESLYLDLHPEGLGVWLINPGFVATPLTAGNDFEMPGLISADEAARQILQGFARGRFEIRCPAGFTRLMKLLRLLPDRLYFRLVAGATGSARSTPARP
jgi:short-subunit dehydrogenase